MIRYSMILFLFLLGATTQIFAQAPLKKAFAEGIKASIKVVEYEKSQALSPIPKGYCATITGKEEPLDMWEEVKLESLALFLNLKPALFEAKMSNSQRKKVLCLTIAKSQEESLVRLKEIGKLYPKLSEYVTKVEILPTSSIHRVIPGVGKYFKDKTEEVESLKKQLSPDINVEREVRGNVVLLEDEIKQKIVFETNATSVVESYISKVLFVQHKNNLGQI